MAYAVYPLTSHIKDPGSVRCYCRLMGSGESSAAHTTLRSAIFVWVVGIVAIALIAGVDYLSGTELRTFPLYYAPISFVAWHRGRRAALVAAALCAGSWFSSNFFAGLQYSQAWIWIANTLVQGVSFATVGILIATLRAGLLRERSLSRADPLTSLLNGRAFYDDAQRLLALCRRKGRPITIAYIDLDNFKSINDRSGHQAGDDLLCRVADKLRSSVRPSDLVARLGGDEFVILLPEVNSQEAALTVDRLRSLLPDAVTSSHGPITASIGAVTFIEAPDDVEDMVREADSRMYLAKSSGKNRVHLDVAGLAAERSRAFD